MRLAMRLSQFTPAPLPVACQLQAIQSVSLGGSVPPSPTEELTIKLGSAHPSIDSKIFLSSDMSSMVVVLFNNLAPGFGEKVITQAS